MVEGSWLQTLVIFYHACCVPHRGRGSVGPGGVSTLQRDREAGCAGTRWRELVIRMGEGTWDDFYWLFMESDWGYGGCIYRQARRTQGNICLHLVRYSKLTSYRKFRANFCQASRWWIILIHTSATLS